MPSVIRNKKTGHVSSPGTKAHKERMAKSREKEVAREFELDNIQRGEANEFYFTGRRLPLIPEE